MERIGLTVFASLLLSTLGSVTVFAAQDLSLEFSNNTILIEPNQDGYLSGSTTITASTTSIGGYTITMSTLGSDNTLTDFSDHSLKIPSFVLPEGASYISAAQVPNLSGYGYSVDNMLNYYPIPEPANNVSLFETNASGSQNHTLAFGLNYDAGEVPAGEYGNSFLVTAIANPELCDPNTICYYGNEDDQTGDMEDQVVQSNTSVDLIPPNFSRSGYGFAGWNTSIDGTGLNYGPGETITVGDLSQNGLQLYARWIPSAGNMQNWNGCDSMNSGDITALTDTRDGSTYAVAKYPDGHCWMMENMRLDLSDSNLTLSSSNTNRPTAGFVNQVNQHPASSSRFCDSLNADCINALHFNTNNINRNLDADYASNDGSSSWYSYGVYYNWYTATAGNGTYELSTSGAVAQGDLCPFGWHLPNGSGAGGDLATLDRALGGDGTNKTENPEVSERWRKYPLNYMYSGEYRSTAGYNRNLSAGMMSRNAMSATAEANLWIRPVGVSMNSNSTNKNRGQPMRCIASNEVTIGGNIHYDANGGTGTMSDDTDVVFNYATADENTFEKEFAEFVKWNTRADGTGASVNAGGSVMAAATAEGMTEGNTLTLYAIWRPLHVVAYDGNGATAGSMNLEQLTPEEYFTAIPPNFLKSGYGFAGWSADNDAASKLLAGTSVTVYGPNQKIAVDSNFLANEDDNNTVTLYAVWVQSDPVKTMQTFSTSDCTNLSLGQVIALTDDRDGQTYSVSKLGDGHCWMMENLRIDPSTTQFDSANTHSPTSDFISKAASSSSSQTLCGQDNTNCVDQVQFNLDNLNSSLTPSWDSQAVGRSWYSYGGMYNWFTASGGNGEYTTASGSVTGDICPFGWRLPTGGNGGEYATLNTAIGGTLRSDERLRSFPNNFVYSGDFNKTAPGGRGTYGRYWSPTAQSTVKAFRMGFTAQTVTPTGSWNKWDAFAVRCIVQ